MDIKSTLSRNKMQLTSHRRKHFEYRFLHFLKSKFQNLFQFHLFESTILKLINMNICAYCSNKSQNIPNPAQRQMKGGRGPPCFPTKHLSQVPMTENVHDSAKNGRKGSNIWITIHRRGYSPSSVRKKSIKASFVPCLTFIYSRFIFSPPQHSFFYS